MPSKAAVRVHVLNNPGRSESHVLVFPSGSVFVIDCGTPFHTTHECLGLLGAPRFDLVLTHLHQDHCGGALDLLTQHWPRVRAVHLKVDHDVRAHPTLRHLVKMLVDAHKARPTGSGGSAAPKVPLLRDLKVTESRNRSRIYSETALGTEISLDLLFPKHVHVLDAVQSGDPNRAGAVLRLRVGSTVMLFGNDAHLPGWNWLVKTDAPLSAQAAQIPHHGDPQGPTRAFDVAELARRIRPRVAVVSVGTANVNGHPTRAAIEAFRDQGARIFCTQLTPQCHRGAAALGHVLTPTEAYDTGRQGTNCMGSIILSLSDQDPRVRVLHQADHEAAIQRAVPDRLCRPL